MTTTTTSTAPSRYSEQAVNTWLRDNIPDPTLRARLIGLIDGVRDLAYQRGIAGQRPYAKAGRLKIIRLDQRIDIDL